MRYLGGKVKIGGRIVQAILADLGVKRVGLAADICAGAGGVTHRLADVSDRVVAVEYHAGLVNLMRAVQGGWVPPLDISREEYERLRTAPQDEPLTAFAGFGSAFGGMLWAAYAKPSGPRRLVPAGDNPAAESSRSLRKHTRRNVEHVCADAIMWEPPPGLEVAYIDPPYEGTAGYRGTPPQPAGAWWRKAQALADTGVAVYLSEYAGPPEGVQAREVWTHANHCAMTRAAKTAKRTERLWRVLGRSAANDAASPMVLAA